jgi:uncharacterized protein YkwD
MLGFALAVLAVASAGPDAMASGCAMASAKPTRSSPTTAERAALCLINGQRRTRGLKPLRLNRALSAAARQHSRDMVQRHYFSHTTPDGSGPVQRVGRTGYLAPGRGWELGEDLAWGVGSRGSPQGIVSAWMHSPGHRKIILTPSYREVGIGLDWGAPTPMSLPAATYTADFGVKH